MYRTNQTASLTGGFFGVTALKGSLNMKLIVGLGNPGVRYENTRHNAGFMVLDELARRNKLEISREKFEGKFVKGVIQGEDVILLKPETFMNNSGFSVRQCMDFFKLAPKDLIIVYDDMDTPVGSIRLRLQGSAGGHNGMKSVIQCVLTDEFDRVRVGIGRNPNYKIVDYVLSRFKEEEKEDLQSSIETAARAIETACRSDFSTAMNRFNKKPKKKKEPAEKPKTNAESKQEASNQKQDSSDSKNGASQKGGMNGGE